MKKLRSKVFILVYAILSIILVIGIFFINYQEYTQQKKVVRRNLMTLAEKENMIKEKKFIDATVYSVKLNENDEIISITNHAEDNVTDNEIKKMVYRVLDARKDKDYMLIGNLYDNDYSCLVRRNSLVIILNNEMIREDLISLLKISVIIFFILEIGLIFISKGITKWMIKPELQSFKKQKQFIADASHELKTPISIIMASISNLEDEVKDNKWINNIKGEMLRMNNLISNLLDMAETENSNKEKYCEEDLSNLVQIFVLKFESLAYEEGIKFEYNIEENIKFNCNAEQMKQLLGILIDNAINHSDNNGNIFVELKKVKSNTVLSVRNKGKEIPKSDRNKIFERFYRIDESRNREKNRYGLGLAIAKNIVSNHNGKIEVDCINGETTFIIYFK